MSAARSSSTSSSTAERGDSSGSPTHPRHKRVAGPWRRRWSTTPFATAIAIAALPLAFVPVLATATSTPLVDVSELGQLGIVGSFSGLSQNFNTSIIEKSGAKFASNTPSLLSFANSSLSLFSQTTPGGDITAACPFYNPDGSVKKLFFGGNFDQVNGVTASYIASVDSDGHIDNLAGGLDNSVNALYCDKDANAVYVGGNFTIPLSARNSSISSLHSEWSGGVALYNVTAGEWKSLPWKGVNGQVLTIAPAAGSGDGKSSSKLYFGGNFNSTLDGIEYMPLDDQPINLSAASVTAGNAAQLSGYNRPENILCASRPDQPGNTFLLADMLPGYITYTFKNPVSPSLLRLRNTLYNGRGTRTFQVMVATTNTILTLSYIDPDTGFEQFCSNSCPLQHTSDWQEFRISGYGDQDVDGIAGLMINLASWYGEGAGLSGIELYQRVALVSATQSANSFPSCSKRDYEPSYSATGTWNTISDTVHLTDYLQASVPASSAKTQPAITYTPFISESGYYNVTLSIPGCQNTNNCNSRTNIKVTINANPDTTMTRNLAQSNLLTQATVIYSGYFAATSKEFKPTIKIQPAEDASNTTTPTDSSSVVIVADYVMLTRIPSFTNMNGVIEYSTNLSASDQSVRPAFAPLSQTPPSGAVVCAFAATNSTLYIGGSFEDDSAGIANIAAYGLDDGGLSSLPNGGLNGQVNSLSVVGNTLYVGGAFSATKDSKSTLLHVASLDTRESSPVWSSVGGGVDGTVSILSKWTPIGEDTLLIAGGFSKVLANQARNITESEATGTALWNSTSGTWADPPFLDGKTTLAFSGGGRASFGYVAGTYSTVAAIRAPGVATMDGGNKFRSAGSHGAALMPLDSSGNGLLVSTGIYYSKDNTTTPHLVVGGKFRLANNSTNVARQLSNQTWSGIANGVGGQVLTLAGANQYLFIGGVAKVVNKKSSDPAQNFMGLAIYDMDEESFNGKVPELSQGEGSSAPVSVNKIVVRPNTSTVVVGGSFKYAGQLECDNIAFWDINQNRWSIPSSGPGGMINDMDLEQSLLVVGGTFKNGTKASYLLTYNFDTQEWSDLDPSNAALPGPVTTIAKDHRSANGTVFYVAGTDAQSRTNYVRRYDGKTFISIPLGFDSKSAIKSLAILPSVSSTQSVDDNNNRGLTKRSDDSSNSILPQDSLLVVSGNLYLAGGQRSSAVVYDGKGWSNLIATVQDDGSPGSIASLFWETPPTPVNTHKWMSAALVVLVAVAISLLLVFIIVIIGVIYIYIRNRKEALALSATAVAISTSRALQPGPVYAKKENDPNYFANTLGSPDTAYGPGPSSGNAMLSVSYHDAPTFALDGP
ncbi:hypothetical protein EV182_001792, partial [Spiromyces aspiralis]